MYLKGAIESIEKKCKEQKNTAIVETLGCVIKLIENAPEKK